MDNCIFCKIIKGDIPSYKIYEDEYTYAFLDIAKDAIGHTVIVSKKHVNNVLDADVETLSHVMETISKISNHYVNNCGFDGVNVLNNSGSSAEQSVMHLHFHIIPRKENDNMKVGEKIELSYNINNCNEELDITHSKLKM